VRRSTWSELIEKAFMIAAASWVGQDLYNEGPQLGFAYRCLRIVADRAALHGGRALN
jgi:hypothetical protein